MASDEINVKETIADVFGRAAATYDHVGTRFFSYFGQKLVEYAGVPEVARVLDVATGRGASLFAAAEKVGPGGEVIGIDLTPEMVEQTGREIVERGLTNARTMQMDAENLSFADESFDAVICGFAVFFMPDIDHALAEFKRVLKPGGALALSTNTEHDGTWTWDIELRKKYGTPRADQMAAGHSQKDFTMPSGMAALVAGAGFEKLEARLEALEFIYKDAEEWWLTRWSHFARYDMERMTPANLAKYKAEAFATFTGLMQPDGFHTVFRALFTRAVKPRS